MHLTSLATGCSIFLYGGLPKDFARIRTTIWNRESMCRVLVSASLAGRLSVSALRIRGSMGYETRFVPLCSLSLTNLRYRWYDFSGQQEASATLVSCHLASDQSEIWNKRNGFATYAWFGKLSHSLDLVAQTPAGYGTTGARSSFGYG